MTGRLRGVAAAALVASALGVSTAPAGTPEPWVEKNVAYGEAQNPQCPQRAVGEHCVDDNGVNVDIPKLYDNRTLQRSLKSLSAQLAGVAGVDQSSLLSRIANVSGGSLSQTAFNLQLAGAPIPGVTTTASNLTPQIAQTNELVTGTAPSGPTSQTTNQTITTTPSNTVQNSDDAADLQSRAADAADGWRLCRALQRRAKRVGNARQGDGAQLPDLRLATAAAGLAG